MWPPYEFAAPLSSFREPTETPADDPNAGVLHSVCFNRAWLPLILGALLQLAQDTNWNTEDESAKALAQGRAQLLLDMFMQGWCEMTTGMVAFFAGATPPDGWLVCDGAAVDRTCYAALFATIGTVFGSGDGSTTFNLPDLGGRLPIGTGQQPEMTIFGLGDTGGEETHTLSVDEIPAHKHTDNGHVHSTGNSLTIVALTGEEPVLAPNPLPANTGTGYADLQNTGGGEAHNTLPPFLALLPIIKT
jgi:microcystin-dependent protein